MKLEGEQTLLRVYVRNTDKQGWFSAPAAETLVERAKTHGLSGATVLRGFFGLDVNGELLQTSKWSLVEHVPVIVEFVDSREAIGSFLSVVEEVVWEGMATLERGHVLLYRHNRDAAAKSSVGLEVPESVTPLSTLPVPRSFPS